MQYGGGPPPSGPEATSDGLQVHGASSHDVSRLLSAMETAVWVREGEGEGEKRGREGGRECGCVYVL